MHRANGILTEFALPATDPDGVVEVALWAPEIVGAHEAGHRIVRPVLRDDHVVSVRAGQTIVTLRQPPPEGWSISLSLTRAAMHPAGSAVFDGDDGATGPITHPEDRRDARTRSALQDAK